jgi:hypothetical protein
MAAADLKVGDKIKILSVPGVGDTGYYLHPETRRVYEKIIARGRPVRISELNATGQPVFQVKFRCKNGKWEYHFLTVDDSDDNWVPVQRKHRGLGA